MTILLVALGLIVVGLIVAGAAVLVALCRVGTNYDQPQTKGIQDAPPQETAPR